MTTKQAREQVKSRIGDLIRDNLELCGLTARDLIEGGRMTDTEDYIVFDRTGTPHVVVAVKTEIGGNCPQNGNREKEMSHENQV